MPSLSAILLAAGLSSRMGAFKPLLQLGDAPLIQHVIRALQASAAINEILVVLGHREQEIRTALAPIRGLRLVTNPHYAQGEMLSSVKAGVAALSVSAPGFVLGFADQPAVAPQTIALLADTFIERSALLVVPTFAGKRGHPIVLSTRLSPEIFALGADQTLRTVIHRHLKSAELLPVDDASILEDLDTPEDFARALARYQTDSQSTP